MSGGGCERRNYVVQAAGSVNKKLAAPGAVCPPNPSMRIRLLLLLLLPLAGAVSALADNSHTGVVSIDADRNVTSVRVTGSPNELGSLAQRAFSAHGAYR